LAGEVPQCETCAANLWQSNYEAIEIYGKLATQMKYSMDGKPVGLDYSAFEFVFDIYGIEKDKRRLLFDKILIIEKEVLSKGGSK